MAIFETWLKSDLKKPVRVAQLSGNLFSEDADGNLIGVEVFDNGSPASFSNTSSVHGYVIRADGYTVATNGTLSGNKASIVLPASAYAIVGQVSIVIKVDDMTVGACVCYVYKTTTDVIVDPGSVVPSIAELLAKIGECEAATLAASSAASVAISAASSVNSVIQAANSAIASAVQATSCAISAAAMITDMTVEASLLPPMTPPTATISDVDGHKHIAFGIPKADTSDKADIIHDTASGSIATFQDGADNLPMSVTAEITPVQDLHGQESPYPAGGGKNLLPITVSSIKNSNSGTWNDNSITINGITFTILTDSAGNVNGIKCQGTASANTYLNLFDGTISLSAGDYASLISGSAVGVSLQLRIGSVSGSDLMGSATTSSKTTNIESVTSIIGRLSISNGTALTTAVSVYPMLAQQSTALTINDYAPYSNVCPISGRDSVQITGTGKNLLNPNASKTVVTASGDRIGIEISTPGTYTMRNNALYSSSGSLYTTIVTNGVPASANRFVINSTSSSTYQIANGQKLLIHGGSGVTAETLADYITTAKIQLEQGSTASAYESFGQTYPVTFPSTVYGGTVKVNKDGSGKLVIGYGIATENTFTGNVQSGSAMGHYVSQDDTGAKLNAHAITNIVPVDNANAWNDNFPVAQVGISVEGRLRIYGSFTTLEEFKQQFAGLQFVYELATPVEIDLTDSDAIVSLLGVNNVWADCGDVTVEYPADTKLYIDGKIAEIQALILENISNS